MQAIFNSLSMISIVYMNNSQSLEHIRKTILRLQTADTLILGKNGMML